MIYIWKKDSWIEIQMISGNPYAKREVSASKAGGIMNYILPVYIDS